MTVVTSRLESSSPGTDEETTEPRSSWGTVAYALSAVLGDSWAGMLLVLAAASWGIGAGIIPGLPDAK